MTSTKPSEPSEGKGVVTHEGARLLLSRGVFSQALARDLARYIDRQEAAQAELERVRAELREAQFDVDLAWRNDRPITNTEMIRQLREQLAFHEAFEGEATPPSPPAAVEAKPADPYAAIRKDFAIAWDNTHPDSAAGRAISRMGHTMGIASDYSPEVKPAGRCIDCQRPLHEGPCAPAKPAEGSEMEHWSTCSDCTRLRARCWKHPDPAQEQPASPKPDYITRSELTSLLNALGAGSVAEQCRAGTFGPVGGEK
jgi:hypothetical protein